MKVCATHGENNCPPLCQNGIDIATADAPAASDAKDSDAAASIEDLKVQQHARETGLAQQDVGAARRDVARVRAGIRSLREQLGDAEMQLGAADQLLAKYDPATTDHE